MNWIKLITIVVEALISIIGIFRKKEVKSDDVNEKDESDESTKQTK